MVSLAETPLTGEPDAGEPPVRFGGRGGAHPAIPTPILRCRDSARCLRTRAAFGVRPLAGAVEEPHCTQRPARPLPPSTNDRMDCSPDAIAHSRAGFDPGPMVTISWRARFHPGPYPEQQKGTGLAALPRPCTAAPNARSVWSAPACWRCRRAPLHPETCHAAAAFHKRPDGLLTRRH